MRSGFVLATAQIKLIVGFCFSARLSAFLPYLHNWRVDESLAWLTNFTARRFVDVHRFNTGSRDQATRVTYKTIFQILFERLVMATRLAEFAMFGSSILASARRCASLLAVFALCAVPDRRTRVCLVRG